MGSFEQNIEQNRSKRIAGKKNRLVPSVYMDIATGGYCIFLDLDGKVLITVCTL